MNRYMNLNLRLYMHLRIYIRIDRHTLLICIQPSTYEPSIIQASTTAVTGYLSLVPPACGRGAKTQGRGKPMNKFAHATTRKFFLFLFPFPSAPLSFLFSLCLSTQRQTRYTHTPTCNLRRNEVEEAGPVWGALERGGLLGGLKERVEEEELGLSSEEVRGVQRLKTRRIFEII